MYKIIIFGSNGMLGNYIKKFFSKISIYQIICIDRKQFKVDSSIDKDKIDYLLKSYNIDYNTYILNCIGLIPQRKPSDVKDYYIVNSLFPILLSQIAQKYGSNFIHFTTDCVFDGKKGDYNEISEYNATTDYGISKYIADNNIKYGTVLRTSIIGLEENNKSSFLEWVIGSDGKKIQGYSNHLWNGITCLEYCKFLHHLITNKQLIDGILHIYSPDKVSKFELVNVIKEIFHLNIEVEKIEADYCDRSLSSLFNDSWNYKFPPLKDQINELLFFDILNPVQNTNLCNIPYWYMKQDNFINHHFAIAVQNEILNIPDSEWDRYENPFEKKFTLRNKYNFPPCLNYLFTQITSDEFIQQLSDIIGKKLLLDETRNFWGVHKYNTGDKLDIHVDAGLHPTMNIKKQLTLGIYLSKDWNIDSGCELEIWDGENASKNDAKLIRKIDSIQPKFNTLVLFNNNDFSWHGNPTPTKGNFKRIFITCSYLSEDLNYDNKRKKAFFVKRPEDPEDQEKDILRLIRADPEKYKEIYRINNI